MSVNVQTPPPTTPAPTYPDRSVGPTRERGGASSLELISNGPGTAQRWALVGLIGLRLALGFEFLWAFFDKTFGLGYSTTSAHAWINGGSPTTGFLSGANVGPFQGIFRALAGSSAVDWLFMVGLLGIGLALMLGVAVRIGAISGGVMLLFMYLAVWVSASTAGGQSSGSTNPIVDEHIIGILGLIVVGALATRGTGYLGRTWASLPIIKTTSWLR